MSGENQEDREAAAGAYNELYGRSNTSLVTADDMAGDWLARRFTKHRDSALAAATAVAESYSPEQLLGPEMAVGARYAMQHIAHHIRTLTTQDTPDMRATNKGDE